MYRNEMYLFIVVKRLFCNMIWNNVLRFFEYLNVEGYLEMFN